MSKEAAVERGQTTYEAWCAAAKITAEWSRLPRYAAEYWAAAEQVAAEKAWDEGSEAALDYVMFRDTSLRNDVPKLNPYRLAAKGDGNGE